MKAKKFKLTIEYDGTRVHVCYNDGSDDESYCTDGTVQDIARIAGEAAGTAAEPEYD